MKRALLLAVAVLVSRVAFAQGPIVVQEQKPSISVSGTAEIRVTPNEVNLRLAVETRDVKLDEAVKQNDTRTAAVLKFLKEAGIEAKDVQTDYVEINPQYNTDRREQRIVPEYYQVRRNLGVRLRDPAKFDATLAGVLRNGANYVLGIDFRTTELRKHRDAARQQAIKAAKEKAVALAAELDAKVGKAQNIQEQTHSGWWGAASSYSNFNAMAQNTIQVAPGGGGESEGNLSVGMISVTATVNVTFALE
jgi:uncharacterized protein YggE